MQHQTYPVIDLSATGRNIRSLRVKRGLSVGDLQSYFNFNEPRSIYKWEAGQCLPSIDNLYALSVLLRVPIDSIIVGAEARHTVHEPQDEPAAHHLGPRGASGALSPDAAYLNHDLTVSHMAAPVSLMNCLVLS